MLLFASTILENTIIRSFSELRVAVPLKYYVCGNEQSRPPFGAIYCYWQRY